MGTRKGQMQGMVGGMEGGSRVTYTIPTRGLLGAAHALRRIRSPLCLALPHAHKLSCFSGLTRYDVARLAGQGRSGSTPSSITCTLKGK